MIDALRPADLDEAARLATIVGLEGLTIGGLAEVIGMSKSGLYAHFDSREDLQLATIDAARATFVEEVVRPALCAPRGLQRLLAACETFLSHIERGVFPGGCFFSAAAGAVGSQPGPVRDAISTQQLTWRAFLARLATEAQDQHELDKNVDPTQPAFEIQALLFAGNTAFVLHQDPSGLDRARHAVRARLVAADGAVADTSDRRRRPLRNT